MTRELARRLRRSMSALEQRAWNALRLLRDEGVHVRRQHPIGKYVADFAILRERLAIEIDGPVHDFPGRRDADAERDKAFAEFGWRTLRMPAEVTADSYALLSAVRAALSPLPARGGGRGVG
ncbi:MAG: DUF559 domain-containing protein [Terricaulis sp.]